MANQGYAKAEYKLGLMYEQGKGVSRDYSLSLYWYRKASAQGLGDASFRIARMYAWGRGVPNDQAKSYKWYLKAANQGNTEAQMIMGIYYTTRAIIHRDDPGPYEVKAAKWLMIAKKSGDKKAADDLSDLEKQMTASRIAEAQHLADAWFAQHKGQPLGPKN